MASSFSETGEVKKVDKLIDFTGKEVHSFSLQEGENFEFYCPNIENNRMKFIELYEENFNGIDFDGVFLDKIRYGAFSNGISGVFSCFCNDCQKKYSKMGLDVIALQAEMMKVLEGKDGYGENPLKITAYHNSKYSFENSIWNYFFELKGQMIYDSLSPLCDYFHKKNLKVGMDTFAPFTATFAGQNLELLYKLADFIKPMMYRVTNAPAGLPFELDKVITETTRGDSLVARKKMHQILKCQDKGTEPFDIEFVKRELNYMTSLNSNIYCGIEINRIPLIALTSPSYIEECLRELSDTDIKGFVLSWNLLSAPSENIDRVLDCVERW